jgi:hypothetical protein
MVESPVLQNVFGTICGWNGLILEEIPDAQAALGTILWSAQIVPQIYQNYKTKSTFGLSPYLMLM